VKRERCPKCGVGRLRKRTTVPKGALERWYRECNRQCGYRDVMTVRPAVIISTRQIHFDYRNTDSPQTATNDLG
jgi:hypothetical protein